MWELDNNEDWALKNWCLIVVLEKTLGSLLDSKKIKLVNPKWNQPKYSLEGLMLKLQYFGHLMRWADSLEKTLMLGKIEGRRRRGKRGWDGWMASPTQWTCEVKVAQSCLTLCDSPWNSPGENTGVGNLSLLQRIFPTQGLNPGLPLCRQILYQLSHKGSPRILE